MDRGGQEHGDTLLLLCTRLHCGPRVGEAAHSTSPCAVRGTVVDTEDWWVGLATVDSHVMETIMAVRIHVLHRDVPHDVITLQ